MIERGGAEGLGVFLLSLGRPRSFDIGGAVRGGGDGGRLKAICELDNTGDSGGGRGGLKAG